MKGATRRVDEAQHAGGISIHAPMKGATHRTTCHKARVPDFNPRTHEGCDQDEDKAAKKEKRISIHAPMKGATAVSARSAFSDSNFNPRTHEGCDKQV